MTEYVPGAALGDYVALLSGHFPDELCDRLVGVFEARAGRNQPIAAGDVKLFSQWDFTDAASYPAFGLGPLHTEVVECFKAALAQYREHVPAGGLPVDAMGWENIRLKRYQPGTGQHFPPHVDVVDYNTARRGLGFFVYLNDVEEGGETSFPHLDISVQPKRGNVLIFPPLWMYSHDAAPAISGPKYLCQSYLHYR